MDIILRAKEFAKKKHGDIKRKYTPEPYYSHPFAVAARLKAFDKYKNNDAVLAAAYLHDILEDTLTTYEELLEKFNTKIADLVQELTSNKEYYNDTNEDMEPSKPSAKAQYLTDKINNMSKDARIIKLADREHNVSQIADAPNTFIKRYTKETQYILEHLHFEPNKEEQDLINSIWEKIRPFLTQ